jgi:DNA-binding NtrC family response regulator
MKAQITKQLLLIGAPNHPWRKTLEAAVKPLFSELEAVDETQSYLKGYRKKYDLAIIDATVIAHPEELVTRLQSQLPSARIIVVAAAPSWHQAREVFLAGAMDYAKKTEDKDKLSKLLSDLLEKPWRDAASATGRSQDG